MPTDLKLLPLPTALPSSHSARHTHPTAGAAAPEGCVHHLFEQQVQRAPDAVALVYEAQRLTYRELNRRADRLAHQLRLLGVGPNGLVGLCVERSPEMVVGILGILKAGGAYVPLDPAYPPERLGVMLEEARVPVLVTQPHLAGKLPEHQAELVYLGEADPLGSVPENDDLSPGVRPDDLAYVIFTSGSTGRPKGVMVSHRNVISLFQATQPWYRFGPDDVWTLFHSYAFDFSVWELWGALIYGGRLVVVPHDTSRSARAFAELLRTEQVTILNQTPSAFRQLIQAEENGPTSGGLALRLVIFGGEALALPTLRPWFDRHGDERPQLVNMYGITETTVHVTYRPIRRADLEAGSGSVIGGPMPGWQVYLLDEQRRPVADGEVGEMYVGGDGVARGYLNRPELTAERFLPDLFGGDPAGRLYKSGDLARRLPDGDLVYMGRIDHQVKIRGFRIELLEIEAVLARHPAVREAAVLAREDVPGEKRLVAYVVPRPLTPDPSPQRGEGSNAPLTPDPSPQRGEGTPNAAELRDFLRAKLPDYMVPAAFVFLDGLPITANGKVNRDRLPAPACDRCTVGEGFVAPRTDCERRLQNIWQELLRVQPIGIYDNFYELGGDSLLSMNLCLEINKAFGRDLSPAFLFQQATIEQLAGILSRQELPPCWSAVVPIQPRGTRPPFFCVHPLGGQVLGYRLLARYLGNDQPFYGLQGCLPPDDRTPWPTIEDRAAQYVAEVLRMQPRGPYFLGGYSLGAFVAFEMAQQLHRQGSRVAFLAMLDDGPALIHDRAGWGLDELKNFVANVPYWLGHQLLRRTPKALFLDVWRKLRVWGRKLVASSWRESNHFDVEEALDVSHYSDSYRQALANNYRALKHYVPLRYPGRITVFRARTQPLLGSHCPDLGWGRRAARGVDVQTVPGDHNTMVAEPDVQVLGARLAAAMDLACAEVGVKQRLCA